MPKIDVNGVLHHYLTCGYGPDVVMLHGFLGNLAVWHLKIVPQLKRDFCITTYDLRGHGYTAVPPEGYTAAQLADDLLRFLDALGKEKVFLVGHSFGADICLYFALKYPERVAKLAALEPGLAALVHQRKDASWAGWDYWVKKLAEAGFEVPPDKRSDLEYLFEKSLDTPKFYGPARGLPRNRQPLLNLIRNTTLIRDYEHVGELTLEAVRGIQTETLLVYGENSHFISTLEFLRRALPNCETELLPGGEHFGPLEQPEQLVEIMRSFFSGAPRLPNALQIEASHA